MTTQQHDGKKGAAGFINLQKPRSSCTATDLLRSQSKGERIVLRPGKNLNFSISRGSIEQGAQWDASHYLLHGSPYYCTRIQFKGSWRAACCSVGFFPKPGSPYPRPAFCAPHICTAPRGTGSGCASCLCYLLAGKELSKAESGPRALSFLILQALLTDMGGCKQGKLGSTGWLRLLKYKFSGFHGRVPVHMYSALFCSYLIQWQSFLSFSENQIGLSGIS